MIRKTLSIILSSFMLITLVSCNSPKSNNEANSNNPSTEEKIPEKPKEEENTPEPIVSFDAFGKTYTSSKDIKTIEKSTDIYNIEYPYVAGEFKEIDFAKDLLTEYVNENPEVYTHLVSFDSSNKNGITPITEVDKTNLQADLESLRNQMHMSEGEAMALSLDTVTFEGPSNKTNTGITLKIRVAISKVGAYAVPFNSYTVTLFEQDRKLVAHLF